MNRQCILDDGAFRRNRPAGAPAEAKRMEFTAPTVRICRSLTEGQTEPMLSRQLPRSGTSTGDSIREAAQSFRRRDSIHKTGPARKECGETSRRPELLHAAGPLKDPDHHLCCCSPLKLLTSLVKPTRQLPKRDIPRKLAEAPETDPCL